MVRLTTETKNRMCQHARETFPEECCGVIITVEGHEEVHRIDNIQNVLNEKDEKNYPRRAETAYAMEPKQLLTALKAAEATNAKLTAFYHSHPHHGAYFSNEDKKRAMFAKEPAYPDTSYVVVSIYGDEVRAIKAFGWDAADNDFIEKGLSIAEQSR